MHEIAPVFIKNEARIEALFTLYFLALLAQALIERELRRAMAAAGIEQLPLYPEARACKRPTTEHILRLFSLAETILVLGDGEVVRIVPPTTPSCNARFSTFSEYPTRPTSPPLDPSNRRGRKFGSIRKIDVRNVGPDAPGPGGRLRLGLTKTGQRGLITRVDP